MNTKINDDNNNFQAANITISNEVYKDYVSNEIKIPAIIPLKINPDIEAEKGKQILIKQIKLKYHISEFVCNKIIELRENKDECIDYIKQVYPNEYGQYPESYAHDMFEKIANYNFLEHDNDVFRDIPKNSKIREISPVRQQPEPQPEPEVKEITQIKPEEKQIEIKPEEQEVKQVQQELNDVEINCIPCRTNNPDIDIIITPTKKAITLQVQYKDKINGANVKAKSVAELLDVSKNYDTKIIKLLRQVTKIGRKEAKSITSEFMNDVGMMDSKVFERMIEKTNAFEIDYSQICDETITKEIIEKGIDLANDGNTKKYIISYLQEKFNLDKKDSSFVADIAYDFQYAQIKAISPLDFFNDDKQSKLNVPYLASQIMKYNHFVTLGYDGKKDIYVYQDGVFVNKGKNNIRRYANLFLSSYVKKEFRNEVMEQIEIETGIEREQLNENKYHINFKNGMYDIESNELVEHDPKYHSTMRIPVRYDPSAECPNIDKFLSEVVSEENAVTLTEYLGYCLIPVVNLQRALMVFGHAGNGKSIFMNLARQMIGKPNVSSIPLQKLAGDKFAVSGLFGMLANICPDIPAHKLKTDDVFKLIVGADDDINAEKKFMDQFQFTNYARLLFSANILPEPAGDAHDNEAFYRRWMLIAFPNSFEGKQDVKLFEKLTTESEKSGYLNKLLKALKTILKNGRFKYQKTAAENEAIYLANMLSIDNFLEEHVESVYGTLRDPENYTIEKEIMYERYKSWCEENGAIPKKYKTFNTILIQEKGFKYKRFGKEKISHWVGVAWLGTANKLSSLEEIKKNQSKKYDQPLYKYMNVDPALLPEELKPRKKLNLSLDDDTSVQA